MHNTREKRNAYLRSYYARNREKLRQYEHQWRAARRAWAIESLGGKCIQCGSTEDLHFDHIDPSSKQEAIGRMLNAPLDRLRTEVEKCQLLCGPCHRRKTSENSEYHGELRHGTHGMYRWHKCRCDVCVAWRRNYDKMLRERRKKI